MSYVCIQPTVQKRLVAYCRRNLSPRIPYRKLNLLGMASFAAALVLISTTYN